MQKDVYRDYRVIPLRDFPRARIWAPRALVGEKLEPRENLLLTIERNRIVSLDTVAKGELPEEIVQSDTFFCLDRGATLLPSLIDAHVHLALDGISFQEAVRKWESQEELRSKLEGDARSFLSCGIGMVRDGGDREAINLWFRDRVRRGGLQGPEVLAPGKALYKAGSYGSFLGSGFSSSQEIDYFLDEISSRGIDLLKVLVSGIVSFRSYGRVGKSGIQSEELDYIVEQARHRSLKVMAHASSREAVNVALDAGVDSIEHGYFLTRECLRKMASLGIAWVPTLIPVAAQVREGRKNFWAAEEIETISRTYQEQMEKLQLAEDTGVLLGMGTDSGAAGVEHGPALREEMMLYSEAGLSNIKVLQAATSRNARILGVEKLSGSLEAGMKPSLLEVKGKPLEDLSSLSMVQRVFV